MKKFFVIFILLLVPIFASAEILTRPLKLGDRGNDVLLLQKLLNRLSYTTIAYTGPGSPGNETTYFGKATYNAVLKFQNFYSLDILRPAGLFSPTGYVGELTLKKLGSLPAEDGVKNPTLSPYIERISAQIVGNGDTLTIFGKNFTSQNNVILSIDLPGKWTAIPSLDGKTLTVTLDTSMAHALKNSLAGLTPMQKQQVIAKIIEKKASSAPYNDGWYANTKLKITNEYGESNIVPLTINLLKGI